MINNLLKGIQDCPCGRAHNCDIQSVIIKPGAVEELGALCEKYQNILLVADNNTYATCGDRVVAQLGEKLAEKIVFCTQGYLIPNEESIERITQSVTEKTDLIIGIGSGVVNDLCKFVSFQKGLPFFIVATAPSMDGYASVGAAMITGNMKTTFDTHVATAIIGDVDILKNAPMRMIQSGFGDIIGKYSALNDWKLAALVNDEYFCQYVYDLILDTLKRTEALAAGIQTRDPEAIQTLMEALVITGVAISYAGNSRPASGSEHHLSHYFEIVGILNKEEYFLHGLDVAYSTIVTQQMREQLLTLSEPVTYYEHDLDIWEKNIRSRYSIASQGVLNLQNKCGFYQKDFLKIYKEKWSQIKALLAEVPSAAQILHTLEVAGMDFSEFEALYGKQKIDDAIWFAKDLKDRYTVLWLFFLLFRNNPENKL